MLPADAALVQKHLASTLAKVDAMQKNLAAAKTSLERQEKNLYAATQKSATTQPVAPVAFPPPPKSPSILDGDVDLSSLNSAIKRLTQGCDCPNLQDTKFLPAKPEGA